MSVPTQITDHAGDAKAQLLEQYAEAVNLRQVLDILSARWQAIEDFVIDFHDKLVVFADADGVQLDNLGTVLGQARPRDVDTSDAFYRVVLKARGRVNASDGTGDELLVIAELLDAEWANTGVALTEPSPATAQISITDIDDDKAELLRGLLADAAAPGVRLRVVYTHENATNDFLLDAASPNGLDQGKFTGVTG